MLAHNQLDTPTPVRLHPEETHLNRIGTVGMKRILYDDDEDDKIWQTYTAQNKIYDPPTHTAMRWQIFNQLQRLISFTCDRLVVDIKLLLTEWLSNNSVHEITAPFAGLHWILKLYDY